MIRSDGGITIRLIPLGGLQSTRVDLSYKYSHQRVAGRVCRPGLKARLTAPADGGAYLLLWIRIAGPYDPDPMVSEFKVCTWQVDLRHVARRTVTGSHPAEPWFAC